MAYIGREPQIGNFQVCDAISTVNNQAAYTMQVGGVNVSPETANHMLVSLNGILQQPNSSFTVSSSTITFASNLVTGDVIDFIQILGNVLDLGVPSDSTVSLAKLTATGTKSSSTFLRGDNTFNAPPLGGITEADQWRINADYNKSGAGTADLTANWERNDNDFSLIGTGMTEASGIFSFPSTGIYMITGQSITDADGGARQYVGFNIESTTDNSSYSAITSIYDSASANAYYSALFCLGIFDVTNITTHKIKMKVSVAGTTNFQASTDVIKTGLTFIRLGDT